MASHICFPVQTRIFPFFSEIVFFGYLNIARNLFLLTRLFPPYFHLSLSNYFHIIFVSYSIKKTVKSWGILQFLNGFL